MITTTLSTIKELTELVPVWSKLVPSVVEPNLNYEPEALLPLLSNVDYPGWFVLTVWSDKEIIGFFPLQTDKKVPVPVDQFSMLFRNNILSCVPLIHKNHVDQVLSTFWHWFNNSGAKIFRINECLPESVVWQHLLAGATAECSSVDISNKITRAVSNSTDQNYEEYLAKVLSAKARSAFRRKKRRIEDDYGTWRTDILHSSDIHIETYISHLIDVEAKGWKHDQGSSLKQQSDVAQYFKEAAIAASAQKRFVIAISFIDDEPVSAMSGFVNDGKLYIYKIGYNEKFKKYSVGEATMMDLIEYAHESPAIHAIDSCADPDSQLWNRGLPDRQDVLSYQFASKHLLSKATVVAVSGSRSLRITLKNSADLLAARFRK